MWIELAVSSTHDTIIIIIIIIITTTTTIMIMMVMMMMMATTTTTMMMLMIIINGPIGNKNLRPRSSKKKKKKFYKAQWRVGESKAGQGRDGHAVSKNGLASASPIHRRQQRTERSGEIWLRRHHRMPQRPLGQVKTSHSIISVL